MSIESEVNKQFRDKLQDGTIVNIGFDSFTGDTIYEFAEEKYKFTSSDIAYCIKQDEEKARMLEQVYRNEYD